MHEMEKDMNTLLAILVENNQSIEKFLNIKLPSSLRIYFKIRNICYFILKTSFICILFLCLFSFIFVLAVFVMEFLNIYPLYKSSKILNNFAYNLLMLLSNEKTEKDSCLIENFFKELIRKSSTCDFCQNIHNVERISNISQRDFLTKYAYTAKPVIIKDATDDWTARKLFSFPFFQMIYAYSLAMETKNFSSYSSIFDRRFFTIEENKATLKNSNSDKRLTCQFFTHHGNHQNLEEFLSEDVNALNRSLPWYVGWSNCDPLVSKILREHYSKPYFLPNNSESHNADWIFMGYPGYGARMHIDFVDSPSWQAQLKGRKLWRLKPPHECRLICPNNIEIIVESGDIIVLNTNLWYHQTKIIGNEISITIGAEYD